MWALLITMCTINTTTDAGNLFCHDYVIDTHQSKIECMTSGRALGMFYSPKQYDFINSPLFAPEVITPELVDYECVVEDVK